MDEHEQKDASEGIVGQSRLERRVRCDVTTKRGADMGSKVKLIVEIDRRGQRVAVEKEMDIWIVEDAIRAIDLPDGTADGFTRYLCSDVATVEATIKARNEIARSLTTAILDALQAGDKRMGYPQASNVEFSGADKPRLSDSAGTQGYASGDKK